MCKNLKPLRQKVLTQQVSTFHQNNGGNPKLESYILKPICSSEIHSSIKCLLEERPHMSSSVQVRPCFFSPSLSMPWCPRVFPLRLKLSYLWYGDRIGKNLTQFLQGLVLEVLRSVFKVAYKRVRILA